MPVVVPELRDGKVHGDLEKFYCVYRTAHEEGEIVSFIIGKVIIFLLVMIYYCWEINLYYGKKYLNLWYVSQNTTSITQNWLKYHSPTQNYINLNSLLKINLSPKNVALKHSKQIPKMAHVALPKLLHRRRLLPLRLPAPVPVHVHHHALQCRDLGLALQYRFAMLHLCWFYGMDALLAKGFVCFGGQAVPVSGV